MVIGHDDGGLRVNDDVVHAIGQGLDDGSS